MICFKVETAGVRYIVNDVEKAIDLCTSLQGFTLQMHPAPGFILLKNEDLYLYLKAPCAGGAGKAITDDSLPSTGGWNRFWFEVGNLVEVVKWLKTRKGTFPPRNCYMQMGKQILNEDPSGNLIELVEPYHR